MSTRRKKRHANYGLPALYLGLAFGGLVLLKTLRDAAKKAFANPRSGREP